MFPYEPVRPSAEGFTYHFTRPSAEGLTYMGNIT